MSESICPDRDTLAAFAVGGLPARRWEDVAVHLESCLHCSDRLEDLDGAEDRLIEELKDLPPRKCAQSERDGSPANLAVAAASPDAPHAGEYRDQPGGAAQGG